jgi:hypothetical protein
VYHGVICASAFGIAKTPLVLGIIAKLTGPTKTRKRSRNGFEEISDHVPEPDIWTNMRPLQRFARDTAKWTVFGCVIGHPESLNLPDSVERNEAGSAPAIRRGFVRLVKPSLVSLFAPET